MATKRSHMLVFEFADNGDVLGRATWLGPGEVELDFHDKSLRAKFSNWLSQPQAEFGLAFETGGDAHFWPDESRARFAEACMSLSGLYKVRRVVL